MFLGCFWPLHILRGPGGGGVTFSDWCFGFVLGLSSDLGAVRGILEVAFAYGLCVGMVEVSGCGVFGAILGDFGPCARC